VRGEDSPRGGNGSEADKRGAGKTRLAFQTSAVQKALKYQGFLGNGILHAAKCPAAEAQSKKFGENFFDKLNNPPGGLPPGGLFVLIEALFRRKQQQQAARALHSSLLSPRRLST
jgi:hypothetical protein